jgi:hypothetical protein
VTKDGGRPLQQRGHSFLQMSLVQQIWPALHLNDKLFAGPRGFYFGENTNARFSRAGTP